jgi:hypothetical protein
MFMVWSFALPEETDSLQVYSMDGGWIIPSGRIKYTVLGVAACQDGNAYNYKVFVRASCISTHAEMGENTKKGVCMLQMDGGDCVCRYLNR